jgi:putative protease
MLPEICPKYPMKDATYKNNISNHLSESAYRNGIELMRTRYCIRFELGLCPVHQGAKDTGPLYLLNNGQRFGLKFDCKNCEMVLIQG